MATTINELLNKYGSDRKNLIPILQEVQEKKAISPRIDFGTQQLSGHL